MAKGRGDYYGSVFISGDAVASEHAVGTAEPVLETLERQKADKRKKPKRQPRYNVILWDSDDHSFEYVIAMMQQLFGFPVVKGFELAEEVHTRGRAIVLTTTREHAELKRDQIHAFGKDAEINSSKGSMWSTIEPVC